MNTLSNIKITSSNCNGMGNSLKRCSLLNHLISYNPDIMILCDTRLNYEIERDIKNKFQFDIYSNYGQNASRGVSILFKKSLCYKIEKIVKDDIGNYLLMKVSLNDFSVCLGAVYGPNTDSPVFFEDLFSKISEINCQLIVVGGDWNTTINHSLDNINYSNPRNPRARSKINHLMETYFMKDPFRILHGNKKEFTWVRNGGNQKARLDYFLISELLRQYLTDYTSYPNIFSDHKTVSMSLDFTKFSLGRGYWKFQNSLLKDITYVNNIHRIIKELYMKYVKSDLYANFLQECSVQEFEEFLTRDFEQLSHLDLNINHNLFFDMLLNDIRGFSIGYVANKNRENRNILNDLSNDLNRLLELGLENSLEYNAKKDEYERVRNSKTEDIILEQKADWIKNGEKPTSFFLQLEKSRNSQKYISELIVENNDVTRTIKNQGEIESEIKKHYSDLFQNKDDHLSINDIKDYLGSEFHDKQIDEDLARHLEMEISFDEIAEALKKSNKSSAPGISGFSFSFYAFFWPQLRFLIKKMINYSFLNESLPQSQRQGLISLIPKGNKANNKISNWRPITLLSSIYKIISSIIANRMIKVVPDLINSSQTGFIPSRYIGEGIRQTYDIIEYAKKHKKLGILLIIDFAKAFDSISFKFIYKTLKFFGFRDNIIKWVEILLSNFSASILHAGNISTSFPILRGCRQGDPLSPILFILSIEILSIKIRNSQNISGFKIHNLETYLSMYADDLTIFLDYCENSLRSAIDVIKNFYKLSGLLINVEKTVCVLIGKKDFRNHMICNDLNLKWDSKFTMLGVVFDNWLDSMHENFNKKKKDIISETLKWEHRFLTPIGRSIIAKSLLLSKLSHLAIVLPCIEKKLLKDMENCIYKFIWGGSDKTKRVDAKLRFEFGGLSFPDLESSWLSFKISWFRRIKNDANKTWAIILDKQISYIKPNLSIKNMDEWSLQDIAYLGKNLESKFWKESFMALYKIYSKFIEINPHQLLFTRIWNSKFFLRNNSFIFKQQFQMMGDKIDFPFQIIKNVQNSAAFISNQEARQLFGDSFCEQGFINLKVIINMALAKNKVRLSDINLSFPVRPSLVNLLCLSKKGCNKWGNIAKKFTLNTKNVTLREQKWENNLGTILGPPFWDLCYKRLGMLNFDNKIRLMQYHILKGTLKTNKILSKFIPDKSDLCSLCNNSIETIQHLFYECEISRNLFDHIFDRLNPMWCVPNTILSRSEVLFGKREFSPYHPRSILIMFIKRHIWVMRCIGLRPSGMTFFKWFKNELRAHVKAESIPFLSNEIYFQNIADMVG